MKLINFFVTLISNGEECEGLQLFALQFCYVIFRTNVVFLFYSLFNDAVSSSHYKVSHGRTMN